MRPDAIGLQISLDIEGKRAVVVGGDAEAEDKVGRLLDAGATVSVVAREATMGLSLLAAGGKISLYPRDFAAGDLNEADLLFVCSRDPELGQRAFDAAARVGVATWVMDDPEHSDLAMPALAKIGRARIAVSTGGGAPALAGKIRAALERDLGPRFAKFVEHLATERARLRTDEPDAEARRDQLRQLVADFDLALQAHYPDDKI